MTDKECFFVIVCLVNAAISVLYLVWGICVAVPAKNAAQGEENPVLHDNRRAYVIRFIVMLLCPVTGPLFFLGSHLLFLLFFRREVDLEDVVFSKERIRQHLKADEERERDIVPVEEALAVSDQKYLRGLMLKVLRGDIQESLEAITLALDSEDSETSHYAASVLQDELNEFRTYVQKLYVEMQHEEEDETDCEEMLIGYMDAVLKQKVFTGVEQSQFVEMMDEAAQELYRKDTAKMTPAYYEAVILRSLELKLFEQAGVWCQRLEEAYPDQLTAYSCRMKLYYTEGKRKQFFEVLDQIKKSEIVIDSETLEFIRIFS
ncbi:MAG: hypothetical protein ACLVJG_00885 [Coprococcus comes]